MMLVKSGRDKSDKSDPRIEVVTVETDGMLESGFGSVATCLGIADILSNTYLAVRFNEVKSKKDLERIVARKPELIVLCVKYMFDDDAGNLIWLSDYFAQHGIPHTGSDFATLDFDSNKSRAKTRLRNMGVRTADCFLARPGDYRSQAQLPLPFPLFVKPLNAANGNGIDEHSIIHDFPSYEAKVASVVAEFGRSALVERVLPGREFTVALLGDGRNGARLIMPLEIIVPRNCNGDRILGYSAKVENREELRPIDGQLRKDISNFAGRAFHALGVRDFGRIDIKTDAEGAPHFLEANLVPGMTPSSSYFVRACEINSCMRYEDIILRIVELALERRPKVAAI